MSKKVYTPGDKVLVIVEPSTNSFLPLGTVLTVSNRSTGGSLYTFHETTQVLRSQDFVSYYPSSDTEKGGYCNGWPNRETDEAAMVFFNDAKLLAHARTHLVEASTLTIDVTKAADALLMHGINGSIKNVCCLSILKQYIVERLGAGEVGNRQYRSVITKLERVFTQLRPSLQARAQALADHNRKDSHQQDAIAFATAAAGILAGVNPTQPEIKIIMKIETKHFVNDQDISEMSLEEKVQLIQRTEDKISDLEAVSTESKMVAKEILRLRKFLTDAVKLFDKE